MAVTSDIEWTDATWNPITGCTKISPGCANCYAETFAERFRGVPNHPYEQGFDLKLWPDRLALPATWKKPKRIFVNSMSDLFHKDVPTDYILKVFEAMNKADWHQYQILTKRHERLLELDQQIAWAPHIWMGVSVENQDYTHRIDYLRKTRAHLKFLSIEPLLGPIENLNLDGIDWVIVGGESGRRPRQLKEEWVKSIRDQCHCANVAFFFKQWGGSNKKKAGRLLEGRTWDDMPAVQTGSNLPCR
ncbi:MAG: phage Gp37/Gp68 family protein [Candidatus Melainabacteria bacterium]|nr:phage Gp37/Gp68 family protein [Candidatus Melainabacteria bacterium]